MRHYNLPLCLTLLLASCYGTTALETDSPSVPEGFEIAEGFQMELFAAEPLIADPVAMEIDENGDIYVVEMHGYPLDTAGSGKIKRLLDTNQDGLPDKAEVFAEGLTLPTGIMRWKNGFIITDAPDVLYLEDTDHDGKADSSRVLLTGFARSNPQHNLNTPVFGMDNWIYLAHENSVSTKMFPELFGDVGSDITFPDSPSVRLSRNANGRNVRFRPDMYQLEALSGETQFGQTFDLWGHHVLNSNAHHLFHEVIAARYLERNPHLLLADATAYMPSYGQGVEVFPITSDPEHQLLTDVGTITSACGVTWYQGGLFPEPYQQVTFVAEPVHNLVHADVITDNGATFSARRLLENREFLASRDSWFRPVNFYTGPDGALYLIDYYRKVIEHPEWMAEDMLQSGQLYNGTEQGRIYRITPTGTASPDFMHKVPLRKATAEELLQYLAHPNSWWRKHAQRLLLDRRSEKVAPALTQMAEQHQEPAARLHALWTLEGLGLLQASTLHKALQDKVAGIRENAIKLSELHLQNFSGMDQALIRLVSDPDPKVRFQLLCTLGFIHTSEASQARQQLLLTDLQDEWVQTAALSGAPGQEGDMFNASIERFADSIVPGGADWLYKLTFAIGQSSPNSRIQQVIQTVAQKQLMQVLYRVACLQGLARGLSTRKKAVPPLQHEKILLTRYFSSDTAADLRQAALSVLQVVGFPEKASVQQQLATKAKAAITSSHADADWRSDAIRWLSALDKQQILPLLNHLIQPQQAEAVQKAAIQSLAHPDLPLQLLKEKWALLTPSLRDEAIQVFFGSKARQLQLLQAIKEGIITPASIDWRHQVALMNSHTDAIRQRSRKLLTVPGSETDMVQAYQTALQLQPEPEHGKSVFERSCASCHQIRGSIGKAFGPDLSTVRNRQPRFIMEDILMPNKSIADGFEYWEVRKKDGKAFFGIIRSETTHTITLVNASGQETTIPRSEIDSLQASELSAMPAGLDKQITPQDMADLLAFLRQSQL